MSTDTNDYKHQLVDKLLDLGTLKGFEERSSLLEGLPGAYLIQRDEGNARNDLLRIVDFALLMGRTASGIPTIEIVHRNVMHYVPPDTHWVTAIDQLFQSLMAPTSEPTSILSGDEIPFVNRQDELNNILSDIAPPYHLIEAPAGFGKTKIMNALHARFRERDKNYLCGSASGLNKNSFMNVIAELCSSLGIPPTGILPLSALPKEDERLFELARDLGDQHASFILGKYFPNPSVPDVFAGVAILIDDLDRISSETTSRKKLIGQVKKEIRLLVDGYIRALQEGLTIKTPFRSQNRFRVVISLRYGSEYSELANYLPFHEMALRPFDYRVVSETVARVLKGFEREDLDQISAHLLYLTGGHPDCIIDLLTSYNSKPVRTERFEKAEYTDSIWKDVVKPRVQEIKDSIPENLLSVFLALSFYRVFNTTMLGTLIEEGYLVIDCNQHELADRLTLTYLYQRRGQLLSDAITRRLFAIEQRHKITAPEFKKRCDRAFALCLQQLDNVQRQNADEWALECFYQFLQGGTHNVQEHAHRMTMSKTFREEIVPQIMKAYAKNSTDFEADRSLLVQKIRRDWELTFTVNYFLREKEFNNEPIQEFVALIEQWQPDTSDA